MAGGDDNHLLMNMPIRKNESTCSHEDALKSDLPVYALLDELTSIVRRAGKVVMTVYAGEWGVRSKPDHSPVTKADELAESLITSALTRLSPDIPCVAEEAFAAGRTPTVGERFWLVDPLDGTREFIHRNDEFTVNIALIEDSKPVLGVLYAPAIDRLFAGAIKHGATVEDARGKRRIRCRVAPPEGMTVLTSRWHGDQALLRGYLQSQKVAQTHFCGSSLKLGLLAEGQGDLYPRFGRTMEWDTAAGHAILSAAGGRLTDMNGNELRYGKPGFENPDFVASGQ